MSYFYEISILIWPLTAAGRANSKIEPNWKTSRLLENTKSWSTRIRHRKYWTDLTFIIVGPRAFFPSRSKMEKWHLTHPTSKDKNDTIRSSGLLTAREVKCQNEAGLLKDIQTAGNRKCGVVQTPGIAIVKLEQVFTLMLVGAKGGDKSLLKQPTRQDNKRIIKNKKKVEQGVVTFVLLGARITESVARPKLRLTT